MAQDSQLDIVRRYGEPTKELIATDNPHFTDQPELVFGAYVGRDTVDGLWDIPAHPYLEYRDSGTGWRASYSWFDGSGWGLGAN